jgi:hypothetical protein
VTCDTLLVVPIEFVDPLLVLSPSLPCSSLSHLLPRLPPSLALVVAFRVVAHIPYFALTGKPTFLCLKPLVLRRFEEKREEKEI